MGNEAQVVRESCSVLPADGGEPVSQEQLNQAIEMMSVRTDKYLEADKLKHEEIQAQIESMGSSQKNLLRTMQTELQDFEAEVRRSHLPKTISRLELQDSMANPTHDLKESMWDACVFVNMGFFDLGHTLTMAFCIVANYLFQLMFLYVASDMGEGDFDEGLEHDMRQWRVTFGHDLQYANGDTNRPLVADVCASTSRGAMMQGNGQAFIFDSVQNYFANSGEILAILAVTLWLMTIISELRDVSFFTLAVWHCRRLSSHVKETTLVKRSDTGTLVLEGISRSRVALLTLCVSVPRGTIAVTLGYFGVHYLIATSSPGDLILNAMALEVVLNVDEMLYTTLAPKFVRELVASVEPLPLPHAKTFMSFISLGRVGMLVGLLGLICAWPLRAHLDIMRRVQGEMCDGNTDFVFRQDLSRQYAVHIGHTSESNASLGGLTQYRQRAVLQATRQEASAEQRHADRRRSDLGPSGAWMDAEALIYHADPKFTSVHEWLHLERATLSEFAADRRCADFDTDGAVSERMKVAIRTALQDVFGTESFLGCVDLRESCFMPSDGTGVISRGDFARLACPETCGCDDPNAGQLLGSPIHGCPSVCEKNFHRDLEVGDSCNDSSPADLHTYIDAFRREFGSVLPAQGGANEGCEYFSTPLSLIRWSVGNISVCDEVDSGIIAEYGYRSVRPLCPVTCGCGTSASEHEALQCPHVCGPGVLV